jgi:hypothetical protein
MFCMQQLESAHNVGTSKLNGLSDNQHSTTMRGDTQ